MKPEKKEKRFLSKKLFLIDDDKKFLDEFSGALEAKGYEVVKFSMPDKVMAKLEQNQPDVVLLDLKMDEINGFQLADEIRHFSKNKGIKKIPVIAVTGVYTVEEHRLLMRMSGIKECLIKPVDVDEAVTVIERVSRQKRVEQKKVNSYVKK